MRQRKFTYPGMHPLGGPVFDMRIDGGGPVLETLFEDTFPSAEEFAWVNAGVANPDTFGWTGAAMVSPPGAMLVGLSGSSNLFAVTSPTFDLDGAERIRFTIWLGLGIVLSPGPTNLQATVLFGEDPDSWATAGVFPEWDDYTIGTYPAFNKFVGEVDVPEGMAVGAVLLFCESHAGVSAIGVDDVLVEKVIS